MRITKQTTNNECGVCVINSLIEHYFHIDKKQELLNEVTYQSTNGLSISQFETMCLNNNLIPQSYELSFDEFKALDTKNDFFVLLISKNDMVHYIIARKKNNEVIIYDSSEGIYSIKYYDLEKIFLGIYIKVDKQKSKFKIANKKWSIENLDFKTILINVLIEITIGGLAILFGYFVNLIIDICIGSSVIKNLILVCSMFVVISVFKNLLGYLYGIRTNKIVFHNYLFFKNQIVNNLMSKENDFLLKVNQQNIYLLNMSILSILTFNIIETSGFISNLLVSLICLVICCIYQIFFIFILLSIIFVEIIFYFLTYQDLNTKLNEYINSENLLNKTCTDYITKIAKINNFIE